MTEQYVAPVDVVDLLSLSGISRPWSELHILLTRRY